MATFGAKVLESRDCRELKLTLHDMRFERAAQPRKERLTAEQAKAIIIKAHEMSLHSVARAQAFQTDCGLKQKDVIGEWVPTTESGDSYVTDAEMNMKWVHGIRWEKIERGMVLHHVTSMSGDPIEAPLSPAAAPLVAAEFDRIRAEEGKLPERGPIVVYEKDRRPYQTHQFRRVWRLVADAAGVPKNVYNMDSRPDE
jgi:hypothetical protein